MKKETFFEKRPPKISSLVSFLSGLYQNKALHDFRKKGQLSIFERNLDLKYAL